MAHILSSYLHMGLCVYTLNIQKLAIMGKSGRWAWAYEHGVPRSTPAPAAGGICNQNPGYVRWPPPAATHAPHQLQRLLLKVHAKGVLAKYKKKLVLHPYK